MQVPPRGVTAREVRRTRRGAAVRPVASYLRDHGGGKGSRAPGSRATRPLCQGGFSNKKGRVRTVQATVVAKEGRKKKEN